MRKQLTAVLAVAALAPLALAAPALAAPGNGAQRYSDSGCDDEGKPGEPPFESCFTVQGRINMTETPSGNVLVNDKGTYTFTFTSEDFTVSGGGSFKFNGVFKGDQDQVIHGRERFSRTVGGVTCSGILHFMIVKGEVKKDVEKGDSSCDQPEPEPEPEP